MNSFDLLLVVLFGSMLCLTAYVAYQAGQTEAIRKYRAFREIQVRRDQREKDRDGTHAYLYRTQRAQRAKVQLRAVPPC